MATDFSELDAAPDRADLFAQWIEARIALARLTVLLLDPIAANKIRAVNAMLADAIAAAQPAPSAAGAPEAPQARRATTDSNHD